MFGEKQQPSPAEQKIQEYVSRIIAGESKEKIMRGLPPSFVAGIERGLEDRQGVQEEDVQQKYASVAELVKAATEGRKQAVKDLYDGLIRDIDNPESRMDLVLNLFKNVYSKYRTASYPSDPNEENVWDQSLQSTHIAVDNKKNAWMYRGVLPEKDGETSTRGSFNVRVTPELIGALDNMIISGKIRANYKFGQPNTQASPTERHDAITIYFLDPPTPEALEELTSIIKPYVRGDDLLGKKIADGFFMSEIGSITEEHVAQFIKQLKTRDTAFAKAVEHYVTRLGSSVTGKRAQQGMSEAQYYAIKDVARAFGYGISYDKEKGFTVSRDEVIK